MQFTSHINRKVHWLSALALASIVGCGVTATNNNGQVGPGGNTGDGEELTEEEQAQAEMFEMSFDLDDGSTVDISSLTERYLIVSFGADWCSACHNEQTELDALAANADYAVLMLLFEDAANEPATERTMADWQNRHELEHAMLGAVTKDYAEQFFPTSNAPYNALLDLSTEEFVISGAGSQSLADIKAFLGE